MDGLKIKVKTTDGLEATYSLRPRIIVDFETKYQKGLGKLIADEQKLEHIYYLAWLCLKKTQPVKPFEDGFLDTIDLVELDLDDPNG